MTSTYGSADVRVLPVAPDHPVGGPQIHIWLYTSPMEVFDHTILGFEQNAKANRYLIGQIDRGLSAFNHAAYPDPSGAPVALSIQYAEGAVIAGLLGRSAYGWMRVDVVWVHDDHRGKGLGTALLRKAEEIAIDR